MLSAAEFSVLLRYHGGPLTWTQAKPPGQTAQLQGIVDSVRNAPENIVNAYGVDGWQIQVAAADLPVPPAKFDKFTDGGGHSFVIDDLVAHKQRGTGEVTHYTCYAKGR